MALRERPLVPHVPEKDNVQEIVLSSFNDNHLKMLINEGTELRVPIWHSGMREAFLIHMGSARETIKKKGILNPTRNTQRPVMDLKNLHFSLEDRDQSKINLVDLRLT